MNKRAEQTFAIGIFHNDYYDKMLKSCTPASLGDAANSRRRRSPSPHSHFDKNRSRNELQSGIPPTQVVGLNYQPAQNDILCNREALKDDMLKLLCIYVAAVDRADAERKRTISPLFPRDLTHMGKALLQHWAEYYRQRQHSRR